MFLFGAKSVYKHLFENKKYVEEYNMQDIETELGLNRDKLIQMALLLGSDYTEVSVVDFYLNLSEFLSEELPMPCSYISCA